MEFGANYEIIRCRSKIYNNANKTTNLNDCCTDNKQNKKLNDFKNQNFHNQTEEHIPIKYWEAFIQKLKSSIKEIQAECQYREIYEVFIQ